MLSSHKVCCCLHLILFLSVDVSSVLIRLPLTFCSYKKLAIFATKLDAENQCLINHKCVCGALNRQFLVGAVTCCHSFCRFVTHLLFLLVTPIITPKLPSVCVQFFSGKYVLDTKPSRYKAFLQPKFWKYFAKS